MASTELTIKLKFDASQFIASMEAMSKACAEAAESMRQLADDTEKCVTCGSSEIAYHNYREQPFCAPCADGTSPQAAARVAESLKAEPKEA